MPTRIANNAVFVVREGKRVKIMPGQKFEFTNEELADLKEHSPDAVRQPTNETANAPEAKIPGGGKAKQTKEDDNL